MKTEHTVQVYPSNNELNENENNSFSNELKCESPVRLPPGGRLKVVTV